MQTMLAFASGRSQAGMASFIRRGISCVDSHYRDLWAETPVHHLSQGASSGVAYWGKPAPPAIWPAWTRRGDTTVASLYAPLGVEAVVAGSRPADAPFDLVNELRERPAKILDLTPPFALFSLDGQRDSLDIFTDGLGVGRVFQVRTAWGWIWSNRAVAALLFAREPVSADLEAWAQSAVADEFFGRATPFANVHVVPAASHLHWDGTTSRLTSSALNVTESLLSPRPDDRLDELVDAAAESLTRTTASMARWLPGRPVVDLSGGRDSRLVAASFLAADTEVTLHSHDAVPGDLDVAQDLVGRLDRDVEHRIDRMPTGTVKPPRPFSALSSAMNWHRYAEGLRPCSYLHHQAPQHLDAVTRVVVGGVGGEVAHGYYYAPHDTQFSHDNGPRSGSKADLHQYADRIVKRHNPISGVSEEATESLRSFIVGDLSEVRDAGVAGPTVLDHFYVRERMRRWGTTAERLGVVSPLLSPAFQRAALALTPEQRKNNVLHRRLTERLMPQWKDAPYYPGDFPPVAKRPRTAPRIIRLADCLDATQIEAVLASPDGWSTSFDVDALVRIWRRSRAGESTAVEERLLRSMVWRASFDDFLADLNGAARAHRGGTIPQVVTGQPDADTSTAQPTPLTRPRRLVRGLVRTPAAKFVGHSALWQSLRDTPSGKRVRRFVSDRR